MGVSKAELKKERAEAAEEQRAASMEIIKAEREAVQTRKETKLHEIRMKEAAEEAKKTGSGGEAFTFN